MTVKMTRKRALELAQECLMKEMSFYRDQIAFGRFTELGKKVLEAKYAELAAALAYIENMARQKEMHL